MKPQRRNMCTFSFKPRTNFEFPTVSKPTYCIYILVKLYSVGGS